MGLRKLLLILIILGIIISSFIYFLPDIGYAIFFKKPSIEIIDVYGQGIQDNHAYFIAKVKIKNNADLGVFLKKINADIFYKGKKLSTAEFSGNQFIEAKGEIILDVRITADINDPLLKDLVNTLVINKKDSVEYYAKGLVSVSYFGLNFERWVEINDVVILTFEKFVSNVGWNIKINGINVLGKKDEKLHIQANVTATNLSSLDIIVKKATFNIYYNNKKLGSGYYANELSIKANEEKNILVDVYLDQSEILKQAINDLVNNHSINIEYNATLEVYSEKFLVGTNYTIAGIEKFSMPNLTEGIEIKKIIVNEENSGVIASFENLAKIEFELISLEGTIYYNDVAVGYVNHTFNQPIRSYGENEIYAPIKLNKVGIDLALKDLIEKGNVMFKTDLKAKINLLGFPLEVNFNLNKNISFNFDISASLLNVEYLSNNKIIANLNTTIKLSDSLEVAFKIINAVFEAYVQDVKIGKAMILQEVLFNTTQPSNLRVEINIEGSLRNIIENIINNQTSLITINNVYLKLQIGNVTSELNINKNFSVNTYPLIYSIELDEPRIIRVEVQPPGNNFIVTLNVKLNITNVYNLPMQIIYANITLYNNELGILGNVKITSFLSIKSSYLIQGSFNVKLNPNVIDKLVNHMFVKGKIEVYLTDITVTVSILGDSFTINLNKNFHLEIPSPIQILTELNLRNISVSNAPKTFTISYELKVTIRQIEIYQFNINYVNASVYLEDELLGYAFSLLNYRVLSSEFKIVSQGKILVMDKAASILAKKIIKGEYFNVTLTNIWTRISLYNYVYDLKIPFNYTFSFLIPFDLIINIPDFTIKPFGDIIEAKVEVYSTKLNVKAKVNELLADIYSPEDKFLGQIRLISLYEKTSAIFAAIMEAKINQEAYNYAAPLLVNGQPINVFAKNVKIKAEVNGINLIFNFNNETLSFSINTSFSYDYNFKIDDVDALPPGTIFPIYTTIQYKINNGVHAPITFLNATMDIYNTTNYYLGKGYLMNQLTIYSDQGSISATFKYVLNVATASWFAYRLITYGDVSFVIKNIVVKVKIYNFTVNVPLRDLTYNYKTEPIRIDVLNIRITGIILIPPTVYAVADVKVNNPFRFGVTVTYIQGTSYTLRFDIYESRREAHPGTYLGYGYYTNVFFVAGKTYYIISSLSVVVTNPIHLLTPPHFVGGSIKIYVDALNGKAGIKIYDLYITTNFEKYEIYVQYP
jgi:Late embryogenesis abundant protein.